MTDHPANLVFADGEPVEKDQVRRLLRRHTPLVLSSVAQLQELATQETRLVVIASSGRLYSLDEGDLTSGDDGYLVIVSGGSRRFKLVAPEGSDGLEGARGAPGRKGDRGPKGEPGKKGDPAVVSTNLRTSVISTVINNWEKPIKAGNYALVTPGYSGVITEARYSANIAQTNARVSLNIIGASGDITPWTLAGTKVPANRVSGPVVLSGLRVGAGDIIEINLSSDLTATLLGIFLKMIKDN